MSSPGFIDIVSIDRYYFPSTENILNLISYMIKKEILDTNPDFSLPIYGIRINRKPNFTPINERVTYETWKDFYKDIKYYTKTFQDINNLNFRFGTTNKFHEILLRYKDLLVSTAFNLIIIKMISPQISCRDEDYFRLIDSPFKIRISVGKGMYSTEGRLRYLELLSEDKDFKLIKTDFEKILDTKLTLICEVE